MSMVLLWEPNLADLKDDMGIALSDTRDDDKLQAMLDAAIAFVYRVRTDLVLSGPGFATDSVPDLCLGTLRLAGRWHTRRKSPDGLVQLGNELGSGRVPAFDPDIERLLRIGRFAPARFA